MKVIRIINRHFKDLNPIILGYERCAKGKKCLSNPRPYTLVHYVESGKGVFYKNGNAYNIGAGDAFIILPYESFNYEADENDPWFYRWIGFDGELSVHFAELAPVIKIPKGVFLEMTNTEDTPWSREYRLAAMLFNLYADLFAKGIQPNHYVRQVQDYIKDNYYDNNLKVEQIAEMLNLDRKYLSQLFKKKTGQSIQEFLISHRLEVAKYQLAKGTSINDVAFFVGFNSITNFSRMFKKHVGISPGTWRKQLK